ncbi:MAG: hypothetical protein J6E46_02545, partial [Faecalicoccus sp.]|nr:hypothetical protein [Faecalicoccus sp.]
SVLLEPDKNEDFQIVLGSSREGDPSEQEWNGTGEGDTVSVMIQDGNLETMGLGGSNYQTSDPNGKKDEQYTITASADSHGSITPEGDSTFAKGDGTTYTIKPDKGFVVESVYVDGKDTGPITSYHFNNIRSHHMIRATFTKLSANAIMASDIKKAASSKLQTVQIHASAKGESGLKYKSSNSKIKVSDTGLITIPRQFVGQAVITLSTKSDGYYDESKRNIILTVNPEANVISKIKGHGKKRKVSWTIREYVTGYQIQYAIAKDFKKSKVITVKGSKTKNKTIGGFKKKKRYYIRIRTFKKVLGKTYYSTWSKPKISK